MKELNGIFLSAIHILNRKERWELLKGIVADILINCTDILFIGFLIYFVNIYTRGPVNEKSFPVSLISQNFYLIIFAFCALFTVKNIVAFRLTKKRLQFVYGVAGRISQHELNKFLETDFEKYVNTDSSAQEYKIKHLPIEFAHYVLKGIQDTGAQIFIGLFALAGIIIYSRGLFIYVGITILPSLFLCNFVYKKKLKGIRETVRENNQVSIKYLNEALHGYIESIIFDKKDFFVNRFSKSQNKLNSHLAAQQSIQVLPSRMIELFAVTGLFVLIIINKFTGGSAISIVTIGAFAASAYKLIPGLVKIINASAQMKSYGFTVNELSKANISRVDNQSITDPLTSISLKNIFFHYKGNQVVHDFSLTMETGEFVVLTGLSGKGKTTIINILLGFLEPKSGAVLFNGVKLNAGKRKNYYKHISYVKQQPFFINDTILNNVVLGAEQDTSRLLKAMSDTGLQTLGENGNATGKIICEKGKNISGGQRQRISFARSLYKNFDVLVLDEPFNELDELSELKMIEQLRNIADEGKIVLMITHNKSAKQFCHRFIDLNE